MKDAHDSSPSGVLNDAQVKALLSLALQKTSVNGGEPSKDDPIARAQDALGEVGAASGEVVTAVLSRVSSGALELDELRAAKDMAKRLLPVAVTQSQKDAVALLYHLAVAVALVHYRENISSQPLSASHRVYADLAEKLTGESASFFRQAARNLTPEHE